MAESFETMTPGVVGAILEIPNDKEAKDLSDSLFYEHVEPLIRSLESSDAREKSDAIFQSKMDALMSDLAELIGEPSIKMPEVVIDSLLEKISIAKQKSDLKFETINALEYCADEIKNVKKSFLH